MTNNLNRGGNFAHAFDVLKEDIVARKRMEQLLQSAKDDWENSFNAIHDAITIHDRDFNIIRNNRAAEELLGLPALTISRKKCYESYHGKDCPPEGCPSCRVLKTGKAATIELFESHLGKFLDIKAFPRFDSSGNIIGLIHVVRDITDRKKTEEERNRLQEQLLQAQKIESIGRLAGGVAHDINNMLMPILGYAELLTNAIPREDPRRADAEAITRSAERIRDITRQLLAFARKQPIEMKTLDLGKTVAGFEKILRRTIRENVEIKTRLRTSLPPIVGDAGQIEQVVLNLAINAQDAMPDGGLLRIETTPVFLDEAFALAHPGSAAGEYAALSVSDNGAGMDQDVLKRIFEPFFTTKEPGRGTGLGLSMAYGIVKQHGGYLDVISEPGAGSEFIAYFPAAARTPETPLDEPGLPMRGGGETLLLVEDQEDVLVVVAKMLEAGGYRVLRATGGDAALSVAMSRQERIDLLITDVIMPGMNGKDLFEGLSVLNKAHNVLYMSGYPADVISTKGALHPGTNFIQKPCTYAALMRKVREALDGVTSGVSG